MDAQVENIAEKIRSMEIRGATDTAVAVVNELGDYADRLISSGTQPLQLDEVKTKLAQTGQYLSAVRPTEPMARNGVKCLMRGAHNTISADELLGSIKSGVEFFLGYVQNSKENIVSAGYKVLEGTKTVLLHCHSSTVVELIKKLNEKHPDFSVVTTETRPRYQGRITAKELLAEGIETVMIVDSAAAAFIIDDTFMPIDAVLIGCDEFTAEGDAINKIGSLPLALAAKHSNKPIYVVTPLLKAGTQTLLSKPTIEKRPAEEVWKEAPEGLTIINPAFGLVDHSLLTGYITEKGLILPSEVFDVATRLYTWLK